MLRSIARATVAASLVLGTSVAFALSTGPALSKTGARPFPVPNLMNGEPNCTQCHNFNPPNMANGQIEILDLPDNYTPNQVYPLRVRLSSTGNEVYPDRKWGFQMTAVYQANGLGAGTWEIPTVPPDSLRRNTYLSTSTSKWKSRVYISHTSPSTRKGQPSPVEWSFAWVAPPIDSGAVIFFVAGNAANGDSASLGTDDHVYTSADTVLAPSVTGVPFPPLHLADITSLEPPYPNPMTWQCADISFAIAREGRMDVAIYDAQGRRVRSLYRGWHPAGSGSTFWDGKRDNGSRATNGVYFVRLRAPGETRIHTRRLVLAR